jgi:hypothetical protein
MKVATLNVSFEAPLATDSQAHGSVIRARWVARWARQSGPDSSPTPGSAFSVLSQEEAARVEEGRTDKRKTSGPA